MSEQNKEYLALYRKYRPLTFEDVIGQEHITKVLKSEINSGNVSHAYLFCGSRGTGKTTCAKIFARALNCLSPENGEPCGKCDSCKISANSFDIIEMDAASNNGVDYIRELRDNALYVPAELTKKVYIIDEVHMLSASAFNALLKTLEEPPSHVVFILATTEFNKIPATILSRCKHFDFHRVQPEVMLGRLKSIAEKENINISDAALLLVARLATGAMRDALSMLEVFERNTDTISEKDAAERLGTVGRGVVANILRAIAYSDTRAALDEIASAYEKSKDMGVLCAELGEILRDVLVAKYLPDPSKSIDGYDEIAPVVEELKAIISKEKILYCTEIAEEALNRLPRSGFSRRAVMEIAVIKMCDPSVSLLPEAVNDRISLLEEKMSGRVIVKEPLSDDIAAAPEEAAPENKKAESETNSEPRIAQIPQKSEMASYGEFLEDIKSKDISSYSFLVDGKAFEENGKVELYVNAVGMFMLSSDASRELIKTSLEKVLGREVEFELKKLEETKKADLMSDFGI